MVVFLIIRGIEIFRIHDLVHVRMGYIIHQTICTRIHQFDVVWVHNTMHDIVMEDVLKLL